MLYKSGVRNGKLLNFRQSCISFFSGEVNFAQHIPCGSIVLVYETRTVQKRKFTF